MSEVISSFRSLRAGSRGVFSPYVISLSDFAYSAFGQEHAVAMHLTLWYVLLVCHHYDVCWWVWWSERKRTCVFCKLCPVCFLVVGKGPSVLL